MLASTQRVLKADRRVKAVVAPRPGVSISRDGHTAIVQAGAAADANTMVRAADDLKTTLHRLQGDGVQVSLTGASAMWSDFIAALRTDREPQYSLALARRDLELVEAVYASAAGDGGRRT